jgi:hypothetical protein
LLCAWREVLILRQHDRQCRQRFLESFEGLLRFFVPYELVSLLGKPFSLSLLMKQPRATIIPVSFMTFFLQDGLAMLCIASTFTGLA